MHLHETITNSQAVAEIAYRTFCLFRHFCYKTYSTDTQGLLLKKLGNVGPRKSRVRVGVGLKAVKSYGEHFLFTYEDICCRTCRLATVNDAQRYRQTE